MSREQERIRKKLEQNPIVECNRIQRKFYPTLFSKFSRVKDPRNQSYIDYSVKTMLELCIISALAEFQVCRK